MKRVFLWSLGLALGGILGDAKSPAAALKVGDPAPAFELTGTDGKTYKLADFKDKQAVVLAWYPKAKTGG